MKYIVFINYRSPYSVFSGEFGMETAAPTKAPTAMGIIRVAGINSTIIKIDDLVKSLEMAKEKVPYTRFSVQSGLK